MAAYLPIVHLVTVVAAIAALDLSSQHGLAQQAKTVLEEARHQKKKKRVKQHGGRGGAGYFAWQSVRVTGSSLLSLAIAAIPAET